MNPDSIAPESVAPPVYRWTICALLFWATTLNYIDRQVVGILAVPLQRELHWSELQYGYIIAAFQIAYALSYLGFGRLIDRIGTRLGYTLSVAIWSIAEMSHALARSVIGFAAARFGLGVGEAGNFPAAVKTVAEIFPAKDRALAAGVFNSGSNIGAILAPLLVPIVTYRYRWRACFLFTGLAEWLWIAAWWALYRPAYHRPQRATAQQMPQLPRADAAIALEPSHKTWRELISRPRVWVIALARFLTDPVWWFFLFWAPKFIASRGTNVSLHALAAPLVIIYLAADGGSILGGALSSIMIRLGVTAISARKRAMLCAALLVVPVAFAPRTNTPWLAIALICCATAGHQAWTANIYAIITDLFPPGEVATVIGFCGFAAATGGALAATATGLILEFSHTYRPIFLYCGIAYLLALVLVNSVTRKNSSIAWNDTPQQPI
jgi:ACS family hexuronate transporter-like MFS transporter